MFRSSFVVLSLTLAGGLIAQGKPCPDQVIKTVDPSFDSQSPQSCGSNVNASIGGVSVSTPVNICPLLVIVRPGHDTTVDRPGSGTFTKPVKELPIQLVHFQCEVSWLLGVIPIVISSECVAARWTTSGVVTHYQQFACLARMRQGDDTGDDPDDTEAGNGPHLEHARWERTP